jgi:hypothetical protein
MTSPSSSNNNNNNFICSTDFAPNSSACTTLNIIDLEIGLRSIAIICIVLCTPTVLVSTYAIWKFITLPKSVMASLHHLHIIRHHHHHHRTDLTMIRLLNTFYVSLLLWIICWLKAFAPLQASVGVDVATTIIFALVSPGIVISNSLALIDKLNASGSLALKIAGQNVGTMSFKIRLIMINVICQFAQLFCIVTILVWPEKNQQLYLGYYAAMLIALISNNAISSWVTLSFIRLLNKALTGTSDMSRKTQIVNHIASLKKTLLRNAALFPCLLVIIPLAVGPNGMNADYGGFAFVALHYFIIPIALLHIAIRTVKRINAASNLINSTSSIMGNNNNNLVVAGAGAGAAADYSSTNNNRYSNNNNNTTTKESLQNHATTNNGGLLFFTSKRHTHTHNNDGEQSLDNEKNRIIENNSLASPNSMVDLDNAHDIKKKIKKQKRNFTPRLPILKSSLATDVEASVASFSVTEGGQL